MTTDTIAWLLQTPFCHFLNISELSVWQTQGPNAFCGYNCRLINNYPDLLIFCQSRKQNNKMKNGQVFPPKQQQIRKIGVSPPHIFLCNNAQHKDTSHCILSVVSQLGCVCACHTNHWKGIASYQGNPLMNQRDRLV